MTARLRVGSWPGPRAAENSFIHIVCGALEDAGCEVIEVDDVAAIEPAAIDVLQIHWPEAVFWHGGRLEKLRRIAAFVFALRRLHGAGVRIVWMVHNLKPHDAGRLRLALWAVLVRAMRPFVDAYVTLSPATLPIVTRTFRPPARAMLRSVHHPRYPPGPPSADARRRLAIPPSAHVYVFFGLLRPYKGIEELLAAFGTLEDPGARLIVAGKPQTQELRATLLQATAADARIDLRLRYLDETEFSDVVAVADRVVLPFVDYLHSSSLIRAVSQARVVITPATPFAEQLRDDVGGGYVRLYRRPLVAAMLRLDGDAPEVAPRLAAFAPDAAGQELVRIYRGEPAP